MFEQLEKLNEVSMGLTKIKTLLCFLGDYFRDSNPDATSLLTRYSMYNEINSMAIDITHDKMEELDATINELANMWKTLGRSSA